MRYYIINSDGQEVSFDLSLEDKLSTGVVGFEVVTSDNKQKKYFVKSLAGSDFVSMDKKSWQRLPRVNSNKALVNVNEALKVYRGFKPSGLTNAQAGDLITDMPGKVIKVLTTEGAVVNQGDTLLILEAMKMENEIKAGVDGVVKTVNVKEGQAIDAGHLMIEIEE